MTYVATAPAYQLYAWGALLLLCIVVYARYLELREPAKRAGKQAFDTKRMLGATVKEARAASFLASWAVYSAAFDVCCLPCSLYAWLIGEHHGFAYERFGEPRAKRGRSPQGSQPRSPSLTRTAAKNWSSPKNGDSPSHSQFGHPTPVAIATEGLVTTVRSLFEAGELSAPRSRPRTPPPLKLPQDSWLYNGEPSTDQVVELLKLPPPSQRSASSQRSALSQRAALSQRTRRYDAPSAASLSNSSRIRSSIAASALELAPEAATAATLMEVSPQLSSRINAIDETGVRINSPESSPRAPTAPAPVLTPVVEAVEAADASVEA